ncbi:unnamed protein product [Haemonchus placei]|uniref:DEP domain-containing protein n=1 Tax=Haemonchus placei TaxID=6290 RepID=A0A0N4W6X8_HAEPC|nr:unnamed protein product [Haemonchus placei]
MSYETISVRMNRSDPKIRWGFTLRQQGAKLAVATSSCSQDIIGNSVIHRLVALSGFFPGNEFWNIKNYFKVLNFLRKERLFLCNDEQAECSFESLMGKEEKHEDVGTAVGTCNVVTTHVEVMFRLPHVFYVTSHTCLPWTLTEQDNKLVVDEVRPGFGTGFGTGSTFGNRAVKHSSQYNSSWDRSSRERSIPIQQQRTSQHDNYTSRRGTVIFLLIPHKAKQTTNPDHETAAELTKELLVLVVATPQILIKIILPNSAMIAIQHSIIQRLLLKITGGTRIYYHSPSPRTRRELAPNASIEHLLHRTPENVQPVRSASATEQYIHQSERPTEMSTTFRSHSPAYLTSEAKRLIEEQAQGRDHRVASPSAQSSSFKRISQAVGQPVK